MLSNAGIPPNPCGLWEVEGGGYSTPGAGLWLSLPRLLAALGVAETLLTDDDTCPDMQSSTYAALATYRSTR